MFRLLIIADDFTGALDTGVQFAEQGAATRVVVGADADISDCDAQVLVVDTETRHLSPESAYKAVYELTARVERAGVQYIYKKTDSALRGNVGAELSAVLDASGAASLPFLPAFPQINRVTRGGVHYIDGVPVTESPFGIDPFEPVRHARIAELLAEQSDVPSHSFPALGEGDKAPADGGILIFDSDSVADLTATGKKLLESGRLGVMAGCAGFGAVLPELLGLNSDKPVKQPKLDHRLLVACGSVNPITLAQLDEAEKAGFARFRLTPRQKLEPHYWESAAGRADLEGIEKMLAENPCCIIETNDKGGNQPTADYAAKLGIDLETLRVRISGSIGMLICTLFSSPSLGTLLLTGGDTLLQCMKCVGVHELEPVCEMEKGVVLARFTCNGCTRYVITKSGGFGQPTLLTELAAKIAR